MESPTEAAAEVIGIAISSNSVARYKLGVVIPILLMIVVMVIGAIIAISIEE